MQPVFGVVLHGNGKCSLSECIFGVLQTGVFLTHVKHVSLCSDQCTVTVIALDIFLKGGKSGSRKQVR